MKTLKYKTASLFALTMLFIFLLPLSALAYPVGQLYWATENYPDQTYLYDAVVTYKEAISPLDYACQQNSGSNGTYTGDVMIDTSANNFAAQKGGWCMNHHPYVGNIQGNYYTAYLYCNGEQRDMFDDSPCSPPAPVIEPNKNLGQPESDCP